MSITIALAGKGGTGKTTVAALIVRLLVRRSAGSVLAIDADPNSNLAAVLGVQSPASIGTLIDAVADNPSSIPAGMTKDRFIEYQVQTAIAEGEGFDVLTMGKPEGPGCYCYANNVLRGVMSRLITDYSYVVIDNEAGLEHLSRRTTRAADTLLVVATPAAVALRAARRIIELVGELKIKTGRSLLLLNSSDGTSAQPSIPGLEFIGAIPYDTDIERISRTGESLRELSDDSISVRAVRALGDRIWR